MRNHEALAMTSAVLARALCRTAYHSGLLKAAMVTMEPLYADTSAGVFQILTYHRVGKASDAFVPALGVDVFERQVRYLRANFRILSITELLVAADEGHIPSRAIAITFDDGYEETYLCAYPVLRRYNVPATVFLTTGLMDSEQPMWNDRVGVAIRDTASTRLEGIPGFQPLGLRTDIERMQVLTHTLRVLKQLPPLERDALTRRISQALRVPTDRGPRMLRWRQIEEMHLGGIEFGAHTVTHPILAAFPTEDAAREIGQSKRDIEERLQAPVRHFAYPNGTHADFNDITKRLVRQAGFMTAVSTIFGTNDASTDRYELRRGGPWEQDTSVFATKLWWYRWRGRSRRNEKDSDRPGGRIGATTTDGRIDCGTREVGA